MKKYILLAALALCSMAACIPGADARTRAKTSHVHAAPKKPWDNYGPFGTLRLIKGSDHPERLVLFLSGDGGFDDGYIEMVNSLSAIDSMVVGIDINHYIKQLDAAHGACSYAAAHFEGLSQYIQKKYKFAHYMPPVLVGYSSGATMIYATLAQSPPNTFAGGISMGFCPDLETKKPFCKGSGTFTPMKSKRLGYIYPAVDKLPAPWTVLQGATDEVCFTPLTSKFVSKVGNAEMIALQGVGHGFAVPSKWVPQFLDTYNKMVMTQKTDAPPSPKAPEVSDLPLVELPVAQKSDTLAVVVSGDGGWAGIDKEIGEALNKSGIGVVGLNSLQYFWEEKTPDVTGKDLERLLNYYSQAWSAKKFILIGYSRGADTLPFMVSRLPEALKANIQSVTLLGLEDDVDFEFHVDDWLTSDGQGEYQTLPEIEKITALNVTCIYGSDEDDSACIKLDKGKFHIVAMEGGHHFGGDYEKLANIILQQSKAK